MLRPLSQLACVLLLGLALACGGDRAPTLVAPSVAEVPADAADAEGTGATGEPEDAGEPQLSAPATHPDVAATLASTPAPRRAPWWRDRHARCTQSARDAAPDVLFIGDSITQGWEREGARVWERVMAPRRAANLGIDGDLTEHVLWRLEHGALDGLSPRLVVLMIGTNNADRDPALETAQAVVEILRSLRERLPETEVLLLAILPRGADTSDPLRAVNDEVNWLLARLGPSEGAHFADLGAVFVDENGDLLEQLMPDLLHPNAPGYRAWAEALEPHLDALLE